ncbi:MAG: polysaccharide biosynthesis protein [Bacilli bacterium]|nr:polysaccharide biosynthesis protein [Bacilli bacterium]
MKKSSFIEGAMIATIGIIVCKVIGLIYVIPFYQIIGQQGGALYSYAYSIYAVFLTLSSSGIPITISKIVSEYNSLEYYHTKEKAFKIGSMIIVTIGIISFFVLMVMAPSLAKTILGELQGGNTVEGVTMVIRVVATALLVVPLLSVTRGYLQGHKYITPSSIASVIEQIIRVIVILLGSYTAIKVFHSSINTAVGIAVFGATIGALVGYIYLIFKIKKNKNKLKRHEPISREENKITTRDIFKKIIFYALPFILIDLIKSAFSIVDTITVVSTLNDLGAGNIAETTIGVISTWATKLNLVVISIAIGLTVSLIPNIASSYVKNDMVDVNKKINQALQAMFFIVLPMVIGMNFLAEPIWVIFYEHDLLSINIFRIFIFQALTFSFFTVLITIFQTMNNTKVALLTLLFSFIAKLVFNIPSMYLCDAINIPIYIGPIATTLIVHVFAIIYLLYKLKKQYQINYKLTFERSIKIILSTAIMLVCLMITNLFVNFNTTTRLPSLVYSFIYALIGMIVYLLVTYKSELMQDIFGQRFINQFLVRLKIRKE